jgi:hypothetical protein
MKLMPHPQTPSQAEVAVTYQQSSQGHWQFDFEVQSHRPFYTSDKFGNTPYKNWELWNYDVVEVFFQPRVKSQDFSSPYLELQVSPQGQKFQMMIFKPRQVLYLPFDIDWQATTEVHQYCWKTSIQLRWPDDHKTQEYYAGFFTCLSSPQEYFSLPNHQTAKPDFHHPELFMKL